MAIEPLVLDDTPPTDADPFQAAPDAAPVPDQTIEPAAQPIVPAAIPDPQQSSVDPRDAFAAKGIDTSQFADGNAFVDTVIGMIDRSRDDQSMVALGQQFAPHAEQFPEFLEWQKQQAEVAKQAEAEAAPAEAKKFAWEVPSLDPRSMQACDQDPRTGMFRVPEGSALMPGTAENLNKVQATREEMAGRLLTEFPSLVNEITSPLIDGLRSEISELKAAFGASQDRIDSERFQQDHAADFYQHDDKGQLVLDQGTGQPMLSPVGAAQQTAEETLRKIDWADPAQVRHVASLFVGQQKELGKFEAPAAGANGQGTPAATPATTGVAAGEVKRQRFLDRVAPNDQSPDRGGSIPDATAPEGASQTVNEEDFRKIAHDIARKAGVDLSKT